jgi:prevent-host-death family protein
MYRVGHRSEKDYIIGKSDYHIPVPTRVSATEAARKLSDLLNRVRYRGERFTIVRAGEDVGQLTPVAPRSKITLGALREALASAPGPDDDFRSDLERIRAEQPPAESSWPS